MANGAGRALIGIGQGLTQTSNVLLNLQKLKSVQAESGRRAKLEQDKLDAAQSQSDFKFIKFATGFKNKKAVVNALTSERGQKASQNILGGALTKETAALYAEPEFLGDMAKLEQVVNEEISKGNTNIIGAVKQRLGSTGGDPQAFRVAVDDIIKRRGAIGAATSPFGGQGGALRVGIAQAQDQKTQANTLLNQFNKARVDVRKQFKRKSDVEARIGRTINQSEFNQELDNLALQSVGLTPQQLGQARQVVATPISQLVQQVGGQQPVEQPQQVAPTEPQVAPLEQPPSSLALESEEVGVFDKDLQSFVKSKVKKTNDDLSGVLEAGPMRELSETGARNLAEARLVPKLLDDFEVTLEENKDLFGIVKGKIAELDPTNVRAQVFEADRRAKSQAFGRLMEGGVLRKEDELKYKRMFPKLGEKFEIAEGKLVVIRKLMNAKLQGLERTLGDVGFQVPPRASAATTSPSGRFKDRASKFGK